MPHGNGWISLLNNDENKTDLIKLFVTFMKSDEVKQWLTIPFVVTEKDLTWRIDRGVVTELFLCNHEEADSRIVLHASLEDVIIVVCSKDTDVLLLLSFAYNKILPTNKWYMKPDQTKYADIQKVTDYLGRDFIVIFQLGEINNQKKKKKI